MRRRIFSLVLASLLFVTLFSGVAPTTSRDEIISGSRSIAKLTKKEITTFLEETEIEIPDDPYIVEPSFTAPYFAGIVSPEVVEGFMNRLNLLRRIAGLPPVTEDAELTDNAQHGAVLEHVNQTQAHSGLNKPGDMDQKFYDIASKALSSSNLYTTKPAKAIDGFFDDTGTINQERLGHRRWFINPNMSKTGVGFVPEDDGKARIVIWAHNFEADCSDWDIITWPSSGSFPSDKNFFKSSTAWSCSLNGDIYQQPNKDDITVALTRQSDGKTWIFAGDYEVTDDDSKAYFNVNTELTKWAPDAIIFRPDGLEKYDGLYTVEITGLKYRNGADATVTYSVDFFKTAEYDNAPFEDVPEDHWAATYVKRTYIADVMNGVSTTPMLFAPDDYVSVSQLVTVLENALYPDMDLTAGEGEAWYVKHMEYAEQNGWLDDMSYLKHNNTLTRGEMAQIIMNVLESKGVTMNDDDFEKVSKDIKDWDTINPSYQRAVAFCWLYQILSGTGGGNFTPNTYVTRAQMAVIYCKMADFGLI